MSFFNEIGIVLNNINFDGNVDCGKNVLPGKIDLVLNLDLFGNTSRIIAKFLIVLSVMKLHEKPLQMPPKGTVYIYSLFLNQFPK